MKRFIYLLGIVAVTFLLIVLAVNVTGFDLHRLERMLTSDGSFDGTALHAFQGLGWGLSLASLLLITIAAIYYLCEIKIIPLFTCSVRTFLIIVLVTQFALGLILICSANYIPYFDTEWYLNQAKNLSLGLPIAGQDGQPTAYWPIGYPLFLSIFFRLFNANIQVAQILNVFLICATTLVTFFAVSKLQHQGTARRAALIMALFPSQIFYAFLPLADLLFAFLFILIILLTLQKSSNWNTILLGLVLGFASLTRPTILLFVLVIVIYRFCRSHRWKPVLLQGVIIMTIVAAVLLPWQIRNYRAFGSFVLVSNNGGVHLWMGNNANSSGGFLDDGAFIPHGTRQWMQSSLNEAQRSQYCSEQGIKYIVTHPLSAVMLWPQKFVHLFYKDSHCLTYGFFVNWNTIPATLFMAMIALTEGYYYALGFSFLIATWLFLRQEKLSPRVWLVFGSIAYSIVIHLPFIAEGRYHIPLLPLFAFIAVLDFNEFSKVSSTLTRATREEPVPIREYSTELERIAIEAENEVQQEEEIVQ